MNKKNIHLYLMAILYVLAGLNHFLIPEFYLKIMPDYIPYHLELVYLSGLIEITFGILLFFGKLRYLAAWGIILLLVAVFPANVYQYTSGQINLTVFVIRALIQPLLILWAYKYTKKD